MSRPFGFNTRWFSIASIGYDGVPDGFWMRVGLPAGEDTRFYRIRKVDGRWRFYRWEIPRS